MRAPRYDLAPPVITADLNWGFSKTDRDGANNLIYDVGLHDGADTAYYLHKGFRVVGIEANPILADRARKRFRNQIESGRLIILPICIGETEGKTTFWICDSHTPWSSLDKSNASRGGSAHHPIDVECRSFDAILQEFGVPYYLKVDIEGADHLCIQGLQRNLLPKYLSVEGSPKTRESLQHLHAIGFSGFKCITQRYFLPLQIEPSIEQQKYETLIGSSDAKSAILRWSRRVISEVWANRNLRRESGWSFPIGSSGSFGEATRGNWQSCQQLIETLDYFDKLRDNGKAISAIGRKKADFWVDFHCRSGVGD